MTVQNTIVKNIYLGNGYTKTFPFTFACTKAEYIKVYMDEGAGASVITSNFAVDMDTGSITYPVSGDPLAANKKITIARELPICQLMNLVNMGPFFAEDIETTLDEVVMMIQQLGETLDRALKISISEATNNKTLVIPWEAGKSFRINDDGTGLVLMENPESVLAENKAVLAQVVTLKNETAGLKDTTQNYMDTTEGYMEAAAASTNMAERWAQAVDSPDGIAGNESSKTWATWAANSAHEAEVQADRAEAAGAKAEMYDSTKTYSSTDVVMLPNGDVYRCLTESTGENPAISNKWAAVAQVVSKTFEADEYGDLMPLATPKTSSNWNVDDNGDVMPSELEGIEYRLEFDANGDLQPINYLKEVKNNGNKEHSTSR